MRIDRRSLLQLMGAAAIVPAASRIARAETYPSHPVHIIVGQASGSSSDITARLIGQFLTDRLGQQFVVEDRPGAGGNIATDFVMHAPADGYTMLLVNAQNSINAALYGRTDFVRDIAPVGGIFRVPLVMEVHPSFPAKTVVEFIAYAKANPGKLNYGSSGVGTPPHLAGELFKSMAGLDIVHVPFREANSALNSVMAGATQMTFAIASIAQAQISAGTVRGLAVTSKQASALVPGLPAVADAGLPGFEVIGWNGYVAPQGTPPAVIEKLNAALRAGLDDADLRKRLVSAGYEPAEKNTPREFGAFIAADIAKWRDLVAKTNMKAN